MSDNIFLSIVIPAFEESNKIAQDVNAAITFLECQHFDGEIIVVDDGSNDNTNQVVRSVPVSPGIPVRVVRYKNHRGKGYAIRTGVRKARGQYIMCADSGCCVPYEHISLGMAMIRSGLCDISHGSRKLLESEILKKHVWYREVLSALFRLIMIYWMEIPFELTDTQCGFKVYRGDIAKRLYGKSITDGFMFEIEIILRAQRLDYVIREFPIEWTADRDSRLSVTGTIRNIFLELITIKRALRKEEDIKEWLKGKGQIFLQDLGIKEGQVVLDFGCGVGHYTIPAAKVVGKEGRVYALDKYTGYLSELMRTAKTEKLNNVVPIYSKPTELRINLESESTDAVLLYDVLHYMEARERKRIYEEIYRILRIDAILSIYPKHHKLDEPLCNQSNMELEDIIEEINKSKFYLEKRFYKKLIHDNDYDTGYILNFRKKKLNTIG